MNARGENQENTDHPARDEGWSENEAWFPVNSPAYREALRGRNRQYSPTPARLEKIRHNIRQKAGDTRKSPSRFSPGRLWIFAGAGVIATFLVFLAFRFFLPIGDGPPRPGETYIVARGGGFSGRLEEAGFLREQSYHPLKLNQSVDVYSRGLEVGNARREGKMVHLRVARSMTVFQFSRDEKDREFKISTEAGTVLVRGTEFLFLYEKGRLGVLLREGRLFLRELGKSGREFRAEPWVYYSRKIGQKGWSRKKIPANRLFDIWKEPTRPLDGILRRAKTAIGLPFTFVLTNDQKKHSAGGDIIYLKNGARLVGKIIGESSGTVILKTDDQETIQIPKTSVLEKK